MNWCGFSGELSPCIPLDGQAVTLGVVAAIIVGLTLAAVMDILQ